MAVSLRRRKIGRRKVAMFLDFYHGGKRYREALNILFDPRDAEDRKAKLALAEGIRAKKELEIQSSEHGFVPKFKKKADFIEYFRKHATDNPRRNTLKHLEAFTGGTVQFGSITEEWLEELKTFLLGRVSQNTAHTYFGRVKAVLAQAVRDKILINNPAAGVRQISKPDVKRDFLALEELQALSGTPSRHAHTKLAFLFACYTGLRLCDVRRLEWGHIQGSQLAITQQKTGEVVYLPLCDMALKILALHRGGNVLPFPTTKIFRLPVIERVRQHLLRLAKDAGISKHVTFHTSRHTFATMSITLGVDLYTVSKLLGHTDIKNTQIYAKIIDKKKEEAVHRLPEFKICG